MATSNVETFTFVDPVHGTVDYPQYVETLIKTSEYQRLINLKQLGASPRYFASGNHSRYEHSLGVCFLAMKLMDILEKNSSVEISDMHRKCVTIAALFHDIGHGPFSHMWEQFVAIQNPDESPWSHEQTSTELVEFMFKKYGWSFADDPNENQKMCKLIKCLIIGDRDGAREILGPENMYLTEIVNNKVSQIDVDKWDYMYRDAHFLKGNFDLRPFAELFDKVKVVVGSQDADTHISYSVQDFPLIENLFSNRANLHIYCYQEATIRGVEQLMIDILKAAEDDGFLLMGKPISKLHEDLERYNYLDDSILNIIRCTEDPRLSRCQNLLKRYFAGNYYQLVWTCPSSNMINVLTEKFGDHFVQIQKRIPLASYFLNRNIILHDVQGQLTSAPPDRLTKRGTYFEEYLIYSRTQDPALIQAVYDFLTDMKAED